MSEIEMSGMASADRNAQPEGLPIGRMAGKAGPGAQLAAQRQALGWTIEQVAEQLKLAPRQVVALESDNYAALPGMATVRGFIRAYAKVVKLDATPLVAMIAVDAASPVETPPARRDMAAPFSEVRLPSMHKRGMPAMWLFAIGLVLLAAAALTAQKMNWIPALPATLWQHLDNKDAKDAAADKPSEPKPAQAAASDEATSASAAASAPVASVAAAADAQPVSPAVAASIPAAQPFPPSSPTSTPAPAASVMPPAVNATSATPATAAAATTAAAGGANVLVLKVRQDSWVEVKSSIGGTLIARVLKAGVTETVDLKGTTQLVIGNVSGVDATLRGAPLQLKTGAGNTARLTLK